MMVRYIIIVGISVYHRGVALCNFHLCFVQCNFCVKIRNVFARYMKNMKFWP